MAPADGPPTKKPKKKSRTPQDAPGWEAIDQALARLYFDREPRHFAPLVSSRMGGSAPLDGINAYAVAGTGPAASFAHWHFVGYGLSELYEKRGKDRDVSGLGIELTFRLARASDGDKPPGWAIQLMQDMALVVFEAGMTPKAGEYFDLGRPLAPDGNPGHDQFCALAFEDDRSLAPIDTPNGRVRFVQMVGLTRDEVDGIKSWSQAGIVGLLAEDNPLLVTDAARPSLFADPERARTIAERTRREGSSEETMLAPRLGYRETRGLRGRALELTLGVEGVADLKRLLVGRLGYGRDLLVVSDRRNLHLRAAAELKWNIEATPGQLQLPKELAVEVAAALRPEPGTHKWKGLAIKVVATENQERKGT